MKNVVVRACSGIVYIALIVGAILWCYEAFTILLLLLGILACREFDKMTQGEPRSWVQVANRSLDLLIVGCAILIPYLVSSFFGIQMAIYFGFFLLVIFPIVRLTLALYDNQGNALASSAWSMLALIYIGVGLAMTSTVYMVVDSPKSMLLIMFILIWLNDTGAYCVGMKFGRRRLFERLSPKKSWEGFWGGMAFDILAGIVIWLWFNQAGQPVWWWICLGILVSVASTWGDLFESLIKRTEGVKDAGNIIPGHGGILDRIDSLLFVGPAVLAYILLTYGLV